MTVTTAQKARVYGADEDKPNSHWPDPEPNMVYNWSGGPRRVTFKDGSFVILQAGESVYVDNPDDFPYG